MWFCALDNIHKAAWYTLRCILYIMLHIIHHASATTLVSVTNTQVFRMALTALTEPGTLWRKITRFPSPRRQSRVYWTDVVAFTCTWEHLGARWITVEQSGKNILFRNAAGAPGNHSYYLSFNNFQILCIQFVFSSMYLYIYIDT